MEYVLERFVSASERFNFSPVLVILPESGDDVVHRKGRDHNVFGPIVDQPKFSKLNYIDIPQILSGPDAENYVRDFDASRFLAFTHPSAYGNKVIATVIALTLRKMNRIQLSRMDRQ